MSSVKNVNKSQDIISKDSPSDLQITGLLMALDGLLQELTNDVNDALSLQDVGAEHDFTKFLKESVSNPIKTVSSTNESINKSIDSLKFQLIETFGRKKRELLTQMAYSKDGNATHVFFVLKDDSLETRDRFYDLLEQYEVYSIAQTHPIIFHYIEEDAIGLVNDYNLVNLTKDEQAS